MKCVVYEYEGGTVAFVCRPYKPREIVERLEREAERLAAVSVGDAP